MIDLDKIILDSQFPHFQFSASGSHAWSVGGSGHTTHNEYVTLLPAGSVDTTKQMVLIFATEDNLTPNPAYVRAPLSYFTPVVWGGLSEPGDIEINVSYRVVADGSLLLQKYYVAPPAPVTVSGAAKQYKIVYYVFDMPT